MMAAKLGYIREKTGGYSVVGTTEASHSVLAREQQ
jgi:hypothetical protein